MVKSQINWIKVAILGIAFYIASLVSAIYIPIIIAIVLAFILNPLVDLLCKIRIKSFIMPRGLAILLSFLFAGVCLTIIATFVFMPFVHEFEKFVANLPYLIQKIQQITIAIEARASEVTLPANLSSLVQQTVSSAASFSVGLVRKIVNSIFDLASRIIEMVVVPVLAYYFMKDWKYLKESFVSIFSVDKRNEIHTIIDEMAAVISGYIRGQFWISILIGLTVFCGMYSLEVEYPLVLGLLATLTETIPIVGPIIGAIPAILLAFLTSPALAVKVLLFFIIVHQIENHIIVPNVMGHTIDLHPATIIIVLLIGGQLYGIMGMLLAVPVAALLKVICRYLWYYK
ncbi:MAG: AI-2E family transporter [Negativicutes bacterium]|nr:AI-2E family transporter [Negativicutes bacterium]